jgi:hypothetical protein
MIGLHGRQPPHKFRPVVLSALRAVEQFLIGEHQRHHRLDHRRSANADAGIMTAFGDDFGRFTGVGDCLDWGED